MPDGGYLVKVKSLNRRFQPMKSCPLYVTTNKRIWSSISEVIQCGYGSDYAAKEGDPSSFKGFELVDRWGWVVAEKGVWEVFVNGRRDG